MADDMTAAERKNLKAKYNWILGMGLADPTGSIPKFWTDLKKVIKNSNGDTAVIAAYVTEQLPKIDAFKGMYAQQIESTIIDAQPALEADVERLVETNRQSVQSIAERYGINVSPERADELARAMRYNGWSDSELLLNMRSDLDATLIAGDTTGSAGDYQTALMQWATKNGLSLSQEAAAKYVANMTLGSQSLDDVKADLRRTYLVGLFPAWSDKIEAGYDPADLFSPYVDYARKTLEDDSIGMDDPLVKRMTQAVGSDGKPMVVPLYEAQRMMRQDSRWQKTDNAYDTYARAAQDILSTFGFR